MCRDIPQDPGVSRGPSPPLTPLLTSGFGLDPSSPGVHALLAANYVTLCVANTRVFTHVSMTHTGNAFARSVSWGYAKAPSGGIGGEVLDAKRAALVLDRGVDHQQARVAHWVASDAVRFTHGFMMEMLQLKMLNSQKSFLKDRIQKLKDSIDAQRRQKDFLKVREAAKEKKAVGSDPPARFPRGGGVGSEEGMRGREGRAGCGDWTGGRCRKGEARRATMDIPWLGRTHPLASADVPGVLSSLTLAVSRAGAAEHSRGQFAQAQGGRPVRDEVQGHHVPGVAQWMGGCCRVWRDGTGGVGVFLAVARAGLAAPARPSASQSFSGDTARVCGRGCTQRRPKIGRA